MAKIVVIGAGFAGHTAALYLGKHLGRQHEITVINKYNYFLYIPSLVWVGIGRMAPEKTHFPLENVYGRKNINYVHGIARTIHADENYVMVEAKDTGELRVDYDYLIVATGPALDYAATEGLGADEGYTYSICTLDHAIEANGEYQKQLSRMRRGEKVRMVIGTGHPGATCQGAAFEYITNIHKDLVRHGVRDQADLLWLSNERAVGDFGVRGIQTMHGGQVLTSKDFMTAIFDEFNIRHEVQKGVYKVDKDYIYWENYEGEYGQTPYDFAMLIPKFSGPKLNYVGANGEDIAEKLTNKGGFIKVDATYGLSYDELVNNPEAWPATYQNPAYPNIFAAGIAFAPPGPISQPHITPNGTSISAAPPRTGMISSVIGRIVALNVVDLVKSGKMNHSERMTEMVAACIASMGDSLWDGSAAVMLLYPVVPNLQAYPDNAGRDSFTTHMEMGLGGAWMKRMVHATMMHKMRGRVGWEIIPE